MNKLTQLQTQAITAAKTQNWQKAIDLNLELLDHKPDEVLTFNRLGVAYLQLGKKRKATSYFKKTLAVEKTNTIAKKFLTKLKTNQPVKSPTFCSQEFIEEPGKTKNVVLHRLANKNTLGELGVGLTCELKTKNRYISVETNSKYLGALPEDLSFRLTQLINSGNKYSCRIRSIDNTSCTVFLKETYQSPKNSDTHSFVVNKSNSKSSGSNYQIADKLLRQKDIPMKMVDSDFDDSNPRRDPDSNLVKISKKTNQLG